MSSLTWAVTQVDGLKLVWNSLENQASFSGSILNRASQWKGALLLTGDITDPHTQERMLSELNGRPLNAIVSDISPQHHREVGHGTKQ